MIIEKTISVKLTDCTEILNTLCERCAAGICGNSKLDATYYDDEIALKLSLNYEETEDEGRKDVYVSNVNLIGNISGDDIESIELFYCNNREISLDDYVSEYFNK